MAHRPGFLIPNASDAALPSFRQAEPDAGDFSVLGNERYGVLLGCSLTANTLTLTLTGGPHVVLVDGEMRTVEGSPSTTVNTGSATDRFDLIGWDAAAEALVTVPGTPTDDPAFPHLPPKFVLFAAVYIPAGATSITSANVTDKRRMLLHGARGAVPPTSTFLQNDFPTGEAGFEVTGDGTIRWGTGVVTAGYTGDSLRVSGKTFHAASGLKVTGAVTVTGGVDVSGVLTADNFKRGSGDPTANGVGGMIGDEYSRTDTGQKYIYRSDGVGWAEIYADEYPPGTVIASLLTGADASTHMVGWVPLTGNTVPESQVGRLKTLGAPFSGWNNGDGTWTLPNLSGRTLLGGGAPGSLGGSNSLTLTTSNLPAHRHFDEGQSVGAGGSHDPSGSVSTSTAGGHRHTVSGGAHGHTVNDPGHVHYGNHGMNALTNFVIWFWGGKSKLDSAAGADASHTTNVDGVPWTSHERTGITIPPSGGAHTHSVSEEGGHSHTVTMGRIPAHSHAMPTENFVGSGSAVNTTPSHLTVTYYVKV